MIATDRFLFLHLPKTGGSFVTRVLLEIFPGARYFHRHGFRRRIPPRYARLPLLGCIRCPFDWLVSGYEFRWWVKHTYEFPGVERHPRYPDLSFEDYVRMGNRRWLTRHNPNLTGRPGVGWMTSAVVNWFGRDPDEFLQFSVSQRPTGQDLRKQISGITLLRTDRLNHDLCEFLRGHGVSESSLARVRNAPNIRPPDPCKQRRSSEDWRSHYSPSLLSYVRHREWLLLELFPQYDPGDRP